MISVLIKNMMGEITIVDVEQTSTVLHLKQAYADASSLSYSSFYDDLSLFFMKDEEELYPNEKTLEHVTDGVCLFAVRRGLATISYLLSDMTDTKNGLEITKNNDERSYQISQHILTKYQWHARSTGPIKDDHLYFSIVITDPIDSGIHRIQIGDAIRTIRGSCDVYYNKLMRCLSVMSCTNKIYATILYPNTEEENDVLTFSHYHSSNSKNISYIVRESTRAEIEKINELTEKYIKSKHVGK